MASAIVSYGDRYQTVPSCAFAASTAAAGQTQQPTAAESNRTSLRRHHKDFLATAHKPSVTPIGDWRILSDFRVVRSLLDSEERYAPLKDYFRDGRQSYVTEHNRRLVVDWMLEVVKEEQKDEELFPLAVQLLDRFLSTENIFAEQLQALASACLLAAGKVKLAEPFTVNRLVEYTDNSFSVGELVSWELLVLSRLKWDVSSVTPIDYLEHLLCRLNMHSTLNEHLRRTYKQIVNFVFKEYRLAMLPASLQAAMCLMVAAKQCRATAPFLLSKVVYIVASLLQFESEMLHHFVGLLEAQLEVSDGGGGGGNDSSSTSTVWASCSSSPGAQQENRHFVITVNAEVTTKLNHSTTPIDIQDVFLN